MIGISPKLGHVRSKSQSVKSKDGRKATLSFTRWTLSHLFWENQLFGGFIILLRCVKAFRGPSTYPPVPAPTVAMHSALESRVTHAMHGVQMEKPKVELPTALAVPPRSEAGDGVFGEKNCILKSGELNITEAYERRNRLRERSSEMETIFFFLLLLFEQAMLRSYIAISLDYANRPLFSVSSWTPLLPHAIDVWILKEKLGIKVAIQ